MGAARDPCLSSRVAVIGSGPAGLYTAEALIKQAASGLAVEVDVLGCLVSRDRIEILDGHLGSRTTQEIFGYDTSWP